MKYDLLLKKCDALRKKAEYHKKKTHELKIQKKQDDFQIESWKNSYKKLSKQYEFQVFENAKIEDKYKDNLYLLLFVNIFTLAMLIYTVWI
ncbi:MAG: hypothetical protein PHS54_04130 [Clostridia bacterium]|nr:hypothetical protein [Clostridia bacterium]